MAALLAGWLGMMAMGVALPAIALPSPAIGSHPGITADERPSTAIGRGDAIAPSSSPASGDAAPPQSSPPQSPRPQFTVSTVSEIYESIPILAQVSGPVTSVSDLLPDVSPDHWAFPALKQLVERHGCISGYGDFLLRGDQALSRYEFAAAVKLCLTQLELSLEEATQQGLTEDDLAVARRLQEEFRAELSALDQDVSTLEAQVQALEEEQFSSTAVLGGEVIFGLAGAAAGRTPGDGDREVTFSHLTRLQLVSSFTGRDRLRLQLSASNFGGLSAPNSLGTDMARLSFQSDSNNDIRLDLLDYRIAAFNDRVVFTLRPVGFDLSSVLTANSGFFDSGRGSISRFGEASPVFKLGALDVGGGFDWLVSDTVRFQAAYGVGDGNDPEFGILGGDRSAAGAQLLIKPSPRLLAGLAYINGYSETGRLDTFTGSLNADLSGDRIEPAQIHAVSGTLQWRVSPKLTLGAWGAWFWTDYLESDAHATTNTYLVSAAFSDPFGREGDLLAVLIGQPPRLYEGSGVPTDDDIGLHIEAFYRFTINDNLSITPGIFVLTAPEHDADNDAIVIGTVRTTFRF